MLHYVEPWVSQSDIQAGERWSLEVAKTLDACNFGIICITKENIGAPWLLFESGALAKSLQDGRLIPLLLDVDFKEISGPLAQFQAKKVDTQGLLEIVSSINKIATSPIEESHLQKLFQLAIPEIEKNIEAIPRNHAPAKSIRPQGDILEELVSNVRSVELRLREAIDPEISSRRKRKRIFPSMFMEIFHSIQENSSDPIQILLVSSLIRDDIPWIYELAQEMYRASRNGIRQDYVLCARRLLRAVEVLINGPFEEIIPPDRREVVYMLREIVSRRDLSDMPRTRRTSAIPIEPDNETGGSAEG